MRWLSLILFLVASFHFEAWWLSLGILGVLALWGWIYGKGWGNTRSAERRGPPLSKTPSPTELEKPSTTQSREPAAPTHSERSQQPGVAPETKLFPPPRNAPVSQLKGELGASQPTLILEPIPRRMHGKNARNVLTKDAWDKVRNLVFEEHGWKCALCPMKTRLECHEVWEYSWQQNGAKAVPIMRLVGLQSLCHLCHGAKHVGCSRWTGTLPQVKEHLRTYYGMTNQELDRIEAAAAELAQKLKTTIPRRLDLTYLNNERFGEVHQMMGRQFSTNEVANCRGTSLDS